MFICSDAALVTRSLLGVLNWTITWYTPQGKYSPVQLAEQYADLFLKGLMIRVK